jgi:GNAT superfamily N-acetyltransferase
MQIVIRPAGIEDLPVLLAHRRGMFRDMGHTGEPEMLRMLASAEQFIRAAFADDSYRAWLAEVEGRVAGGGAVHIVPWIPGYADPSSCRAYVHSVYVEPELRRRRIARSLMEAMVAWCRERGLRSVTLHASEEGRTLYASMGFTPTNEMRLVIR